MRWAAWLGVLALVLNSLVPVHLAFDLAEALEPALHERTERGNDFGRDLIAFVVWHHETGDDDPDDHAGHHSGHHNAACPVCSALASLGAAALPAPAAIALPVAAALPIAPLASVAPCAALPAAFYRSRAPPIA